MTYTIIWASNIYPQNAVEKVSAQVNEALAAGWGLAGGVTVASHGNGVLVCQCMTRESVSLTEGSDWIVSQAEAVHVG